MALPDAIDALERQGVIRVDRRAGDNFDGTVYAIATVLISQQHKAGWPY